MPSQSDTLVNKVDEILELHANGVAGNWATTLTFNRMAPVLHHDEAKQALLQALSEAMAEVIGNKKITLEDIYGDDLFTFFGYHETQVRDAANYLQRKQLARLAALLERKTQ